MTLNLLQTLLPSFQPLKWWFLWPRQVAFVPAYASTGGRQVKGRVSTWFFIELYFFLHFWLHWVFLLRGLLPSCGARASCCSGRSCWGARALGHWGLGSLGSRAQQLLLLALEHKLNTHGAGTQWSIIEDEFGEGGQIQITEGQVTQGQSFDFLVSVMWNCWRI